MSEKIREREKFKKSSCVFIFLIDGDNILLLMRENTGWLDGCYSVPGGIKEANEIVRLAAHRELLEEVGVTAKPSDFKMVHFMDCFTTGEEWYGFYYLVTSWEGTPEIKEPHKHTDLRWVPIAELPRNMSPYVLQAIENYKDNILESDFGWELGPEATGEDYIKYYNNKKFTGY